jgi:murein DD-endopeptidase MepM/ murein hydrolase activator NlpD
MRTRVVPCPGKTILRSVAIIALAGASVACSGDSARFSDNPFTNPFSAAAKSTPTNTARAVQGADRVMTGSLPSRTVPVTPVSSQPLPSTISRSAQLSPVVSAQPVQRVASSTLQNVTAAPVTGTAAGWSASGGTPITVGPGESAQTLSSRYGVPVSAITAANGGQVVPGRQAIIPVYAPGAQAAAPRVANPITNPAPIVAKAPIPAAAVPAAAKAAPVVAAAAPVARTIAPAAAPSIVPAAPKAVAAPPRPVPGRIVAAKPIDAKKPVNAPAKPAIDDEDDEDETPAKPATKAPAKLAAAAPAPKVVEAPKPKPKPAIVASARPVEKREDTPKADTTTTQSIPAPVEKPAAAAEDKPEFRWPAKGRVISGFGSRGANGDGIAIALPEGTPVKAAEGGTIAYAGEELKGYGKLVLVRHDNGYVSAYAHNGELAVKRGDKVSRGQTIAKSGSTGNVTSPQLHFELRKGSTPVDPTKYLE